MRGRCGASAVPSLFPRLSARRFPDTPAVFWARPVAHSRVSLTPGRGEGRSASPFCIPGARGEMGRTGLGEVAGGVGLSSLHQRVHPLQRFSARLGGLWG